MILVRVLLLLAAIAAPGIARAQPLAPGSPGSRPEPSPTGAPSPAHKRPLTALALSLVPTVLGAGLLAAGGALGQQISESHPAPWIVGTAGGVLLLVGPTIGHTWSGRTWSTALGFRLGGLATGLAGAWLLVDSPLHSQRWGDGIALVAVGSIVYLASAIVEIVGAPAAARHHNAARLGITQIATAHGSIPGLAVGGRW